MWWHLGGQSVKYLPAVQGTRVRSLGWEDPLEKEMATHSSILAWKILWTEEPGGLQSMGSQRVGHDWVANTKRRGQLWSVIWYRPSLYWSQTHHSIQKCSLEGFSTLQENWNSKYCGIHSHILGFRIQPFMKVMTLSSWSLHSGKRDW